LTTAQALQTLLSWLDAPLVLIDVGARWGVHKQWGALADKSKTLCFEPDKEEVDRLNAQGHANVTYLPVALGAHDGSSAMLHVTEQPACSSVYAPIKALYEEYPALADIRPVRAIEVPIRSIDAVLRDYRIENVDAIKLDTQGSELDILRGADVVLNTCAMIDVEVEFNSIYESQPLFCDVDRFLRDRGFVLWRISDICHYAPNEDSTPPLNFMIAFSPPQTIDHLPVRGGQLFWAQAQYVRAEYPRTSSTQLPKAKAVKAAAVVASAGLWDLAIEILSKSDARLAREIASLLA
jgi:FkbM family methyltransferase